MKNFELKGFGLSDWYNQDGASTSGGHQLSEEQKKRLLETGIAAGSLFIGWLATRKDRRTQSGAFPSSDPHPTPKPAPTPPPKNVIGTGGIVAISLAAVAIIVTIILIKKK